MHKLFVPVFAPNEVDEQSSKAASGCIWEIQTWRRRVQDLGFTLGQLSRFSRFWSLSHTMYRCGALVLPCVSISVHSVCVGQGPLWCCWLNVHWRTLWESLDPYFIFSLFLLIFAVLSSLSLSSYSTTEVRSEERSILERAGVVQSLTVGVAPIVVVIASVCTFTLHMALGYDLTAAEVLE